MTSTLDPRYLEFDGEEEQEGFAEPPLVRSPEPHPVLSKLAWGLAALSAVMFGVVAADVGGLNGTWAGFALTFGLAMLATVGIAHAKYGGTAAGIKHDGITFSAATYRGWSAWLLGIGLTLFYLVLYFNDEIAGWLVSLGLLAKPAEGASVQLLEPFYRIVDPVSRALGRGAADRYFLYGSLYTAAVLAFGVRMLYRYRHSRYHLIRTGSVMFFQLGFAFLVPAILRALAQPEWYPTYFWPLAPDNLYRENFWGLIYNESPLGVVMAFWGIAMFFIATPILTFFFGKRWYCSWVCGCGGLAETAGDPYRHLSDKSTSAWHVERWLIHSVLIAIVTVTVLLWVYPSGFSTGFRKVYGFLIVSMFSGVVGVGFYPVLGSRVWCRFGCPMAATLGILQRYFSRFRITTNGGQCMSCGNCSTYCEMGIDVRAYAQQGKNIVRASCVGCGVCSAVCPRGVLKLENGKTTADRYDGAATPVDQFLSDLRNPPRA